jgi:hypothetical protein
MRIHILALLLLACLGSSHAQQRPELAGNKQAPGLPAPAQLPGQQDDVDARSCQAELARLRKLTADQRDYIALLEQKVQSLQTQSATGKGRTP